jgi:hypothetical protein
MKNFKDGTPIPNWFKPACYDQNCRTSGYKASYHKTKNIVCPSVIDCTQQVTILGKEAELSNVNIQQNCIADTNKGETTTTDETGTVKTYTPEAPEIKPLPQPSQVEKYWRQVEDLVPLKYTSVNQNVDLRTYGVPFKSPSITYLMVFVFIVIVALVMTMSAQALAHADAEQANAIQVAVASAMRRQDTENTPYAYGGF